MEYSKPLLTELTTKFYIKNSLKEVRQFKNKYITVIVNILLFLLFVGLVSLLLYYKYKGKPSKEEIKIKENQKKQYLFEKLHKISCEKRKENQNLITDLPLI
jgi:cell division protein YceG involved in septum cleavage